MLQAPALWVAFAAMTPLMLYTAYSDIRALKIANWIPLATLGIYLVTGFWGMPWERVLWGLAAGTVTLVAFFLLWAIADSFFPGKLGAGDVKLISALIPFIDLYEAFETLILFTIVLMVFLMFFGFAFVFTRGKSGVASLNHKGKKIWQVPSPFGVAMAATIVIYLGAKTWDSLA